MSLLLSIFKLISNFSLSYKPLGRGIKYCYSLNQWPRDLQLLSQSLVQPPSWFSVLHNHILFWSFWGDAVFQKYSPKVTTGFKVGTISPHKHAVEFITRVALFLGVLSEKFALGLNLLHFAVTHPLLQQRLANIKPYWDLLPSVPLSIFLMVFSKQPV